MASVPFHDAWAVVCIQDVGRLLPVNYINYDESTGNFAVGYQVTEAAPLPLALLDGRKVREVTVAYKREGLDENA